jgi:hypothetical protein
MNLPSPVRRAIDEALQSHDAIDAKIERGEARGHGNEAYQALVALAQVLGLEPARADDSGPFATLTDLQREALITLTSARWLAVDSVAAVPPHWRRRRWLGLAPPGLLVAGEPRPGPRRAPRGGTGRGRDRALAVQSARLRHQALGRGASLAGAHALAYARTSLPELPRYQTSVGTYRLLASVALFTAYSASGATVPEGADERFPLAYRLEGEPLSNRVSTRFLADHLRAVAEPRRDAVLTAALRRSQDGGKYHAAIHLLEQFGALPQATRAVEAHLAKAKGQRATGHEKAVAAKLARRVRAVVAAAGTAPARTSAKARSPARTTATRPGPTPARAKPPTTTKSAARKPAGTPTRR